MQVKLQLINIPPGSSIGPSFNVITDPISTPSPATVSLAQLTSPNGAIVTIPDNTSSVAIDSLGSCTNEVEVECIDPIKYYLESFFNLYSNPTANDFSNFLQSYPLVISGCKFVCNIGCSRYTFASVETYLKYAEAVGLTQPPPTEGP